jgi:hypothetical protein
MTTLPIEVKNITYLNKYEVGEDVHIVKEVQVDKDGNYIDNIRIIKDYKRPFFITNEIYRKNINKKESEDLSKVTMFKSTQSDLGKSIATRLGDKYIGVTNLSQVSQSPYVYGIDTDSRTYLKYAYMKKYNNPISKYRVGAFDIEVNTITNEIIVISLVTYKKIYTYILKSFIKHITNPIPRLESLYEEHIPDTSEKEIKGVLTQVPVLIKKIEVNFKIFNNEVDMIKDIFSKANYAEIDFLAAWNIMYDMGKITDLLERNGEDIASVFHYDKIPEEYKHFSIKMGQTQKLTASGKFTPISIEQQWHTIKSTTNYYFIDAMPSHRYVRAGGKNVPDGYGLDSILKHEGVAQKLKFKDINVDNLTGIDWHRYMVKHHPLEYIIYNMWDVMSMLELDRATDDLAISLPLLSGISHFDVFNSGPKKIVNALNFYYIKNKKVLGTKDGYGTKSDPLLGADDWIVNMPAFRLDRNGVKVITENKMLNTNIRILVMDDDVTSSYPSTIQACNVSKDTTHREIVSIGNLPKDTFKFKNMNIFYGGTNAIEYCTSMYNFPNVYDILNKIKKDNL